MSSNVLLAVSTLVAAVFIAAQAWYARAAFVGAQETRLQEQKLAVCFENFDAAVALDGALRDVSPGFGVHEVWPPEVTVMDAPALVEIQERIVPMLNGMQSSLAKASILGPVDRFRSYLSGEIEGLSARLQALSPGQLGQEEGAAEIDAVLERLSEFFNAQYAVFEGCRMVAGGEA